MDCLQTEETKESVKKRSVSRESPVSRVYNHKVIKSWNVKFSESTSTISAIVHQ